jgi:tripartite-type tricarboxylate transporter receptor subunit TctC
VIFKFTLGIFTVATVYGGAAALPSIAADYPDRPVRIIVPSAPGGAPDVTTRILVTELTRQMGQQFVVDNRPGASGVIGTELTVRATPDGYTIGQANLTTLVNNRIFMSKLPFDLDRDLLPISQYFLTVNILAVTLSLPVKSVPELIEHARANPGKLLFASSGNGTSMHLCGEMFKHLTSTQMTHVPYKAAQQGVSDLIGGQVQLMFDSTSSIGAQVKAGRVRGLAVTGAKRSPTYPELPTVAEAGVAKFEMTAWGGFAAPNGVPKAIVNRLSVEINKALATASVKEKFAANGSVPSGNTPEEFTALIKRELTKWSDVVKSANIKVE